MLVVALVLGLTASSTTTAPASAPIDCGPEVVIDGATFRACRNATVVVEPEGARPFVLKTSTDELVRRLRGLEPALEAPPLASETATVVDQRRFSVTISAGAPQGLWVGLPVEFPATGPSPIIGWVTRVDDRTSEVEVGPRERVPSGSPALPRPRGRLTAPSIVLPPRLADTWVLEARPLLFINSGSQPIGLFFWGAVRYHFDIPLALSLEAQPIALASEEFDAGYILAAQGRVFAELDLDLAGFGVGAGVATQNLDDGFGAPKEVFVLAPRFRVGARDGFFVEGTASLNFVPDISPLTDLNVTVGIPLSRVLQMRLEGSAGPLGCGRGDLVFRVLLAGQGGPGSVYLSPSFGGAFVIYEPRADFDEFLDVGPRASGGANVGVGLELRL